MPVDLMRIQLDVLHLQMYYVDLQVTRSITSFHIVLRGAYCSHDESDVRSWDGDVGCVQIVKSSEAHL